MRVYSCDLGYSRASRALLRRRKQMRKAHASEVRSEFENILQQMRQAQGDALAATEKNQKLLHLITFCHGQVC